jgi:hypothetical protein
MTMNAIAMRQELKTYIDDIPESSLSILEPLLSFFAREKKPLVETDLTAEEQDIIAEGRREYREHPENFVSLDSIG